MAKKALFLALLAAFAAPLFAQKTAQPTTAKAAPDDLDSFFKPLKWRCIGPFRGGRSVAATGVAGDPLTYFMGTTGGGLWKTEDAGNSWANVSDGFFKTGTVGAIAVADSDPNVVFCGMGEHAVRGVMTHSGDGLYKSTDAGRTWKKMGLEATRHISRIRIHPTDPNVVFVAAQGHLYGPNPERGVFKSSDGGLTWRKTLFVDDKTGCVELSMDAQNPRILFAAMNEYGRLPWKVVSGGPTAGLFKSSDAGETWQKIESDDLPKPMGKAAIAASPSNPQRVWALCEGDSEKGAGGLFSSPDGGKTWSKVSSDNRLVQRAWYYIELFVDPTDENKLFVLSAPALKSIDGGKTWEEIAGQHGDYHDLWINPKNAKNMILADDGGAVITFNGGKTWSSQAYPTGQFYRVNADNGWPYKIYGGQQDNTSVAISSRELGSGGISSSSWAASAGGESAFLAFDPDDPRLVMGGSYEGTVELFDSKSRAGTNVMAAPIQYLGRDAKDMKYRFNWNAPIVASRHEKGAFFHCSQLVLKTTDAGRTWSETSPDLTRNEKSKQGKSGGPLTNEAVGAENYGTISYLIESPIAAGAIWAGSDDGLVHLSRDGGKTWSNVTPKGLEECLVNAIEPSPHAPGTAFLATTRYKFNDHRPGLFRTDDWGKTWTNISAGLPENTITRVVREDPERRDLLVAGCENGFFVCFDGGKNWRPMQLNLPVCPITDLKFHQNDLIAATSGRAFWVLDDLELLEAFAVARPTDFALFPIEDATVATGSSPLDKTDLAFSGQSSSEGVNPANGLVLYYHLAEKTDDLRLVIRTPDGQLVRTFSSKKDSTFEAWEGGPPAAPLLAAEKGLNRFVWDLRCPTLPGVPATYFDNSFLGHKAPPGQYIFELKKPFPHTSVGMETASATAAILKNPLYPTTAAEYAEHHRLMLEMEGKLTEMHDLINKMAKKQAQLEALLPLLKADEKAKAASKAAADLAQKMKSWDEDMVQRKSKAYDDVENFPNKFTANWQFLINQTEGDLPRVNRPSLEVKKSLEGEWQVLKSRANGLLEQDLPALNRQLWEAGVGGVW